MTLSIEQDRTAHLLIRADPHLDYDEARLRLERAALIISATVSARTSWGQAAMLSIAECAVRMFRGGVYLDREFTEPVIVGSRHRATLQSQLLKIGCRREIAPAHAILIHVGADLPETTSALRCWADGWVANVSPRSPTADPMAGNEISGVLAGALAVTEAFRSVVLGDIRAGKRTQRLSPLTPSETHPRGLPLDRLPARCWLLGIGNIGQAVLWVLSLLPYADPAAVEWWLQDIDISGPENLDIQLLTRFSWIGQKKTRNAAGWAESQGFRTKVIERRFTAATRRMNDEPGLLLVGVDNLETRRAAAAPEAGFDLVMDGGLGATPTEVFDIRVHGFPGSRSATTAWPSVVVPTETRLDSALAQLVQQGRLQVCGATTIAGHPVGVPSTAVAAAAIMVAQACRAIAESTYCDRIDLSLVDPKRAAANNCSLGRTGILPFVEARRGH